MIAKYTDWADRKYPQNYLIRNPVTGSVLLACYSVLFVIIYKPFNLTASREMSFEATMSVYALAMVPIHISLVCLLRKIRFFSSRELWSIRKELLAIFLILIGLGIFVFAFGFFMEGPFNRWNLATFIDSCKIAFLTCVILYGFLTLVNLRYLDTPRIVSTVSNEPVRETIRIKSRLKGEAFTLHVPDLIYVESEGNYVVFHLSQNGLIRKETIRNSISEVEQMLGGIPFVVRTHRAFIVNINKVNQKSGNSSGYRLQLEGVAGHIPVSRSNAEKFDRLFAAKG